MMVKRITAAGLVMAMVQSGFAMNVSSQGNTVLIEDAISESGVAANIQMIGRSANGRNTLTPLQAAQGVTVEQNGRDLRILNASAGGRYQAISIDLIDGGSRQSIHLSIGGTNSSSVVQSHQGSGRFSTATPPGPAVIPHERISPHSQYRRPPPAKFSNQPQWMNKQVRNENFSGRNLKGLSMLNSRFDADDFRATNLSSSRMVNVNFTQCDFRKADLRGSRLVNVKFEQSDLQSANFQGARLVNVDFGQSDLSGAIWTDGQECSAGSIGECKKSG